MDLSLLLILLIVSLAKETTAVPIADIDLEEMDG